MRKVFWLFISYWLLAAAVGANTILVEENNFLPRNAMAYYGCGQLSLFTRSYSAGGVVASASGYDLRYNQEFYFGLQPNMLFRFALPYWFEGQNPGNSQLTTTSGLFDLGVKLQYLIQKETAEKPSVSALLLARAPSQDYQYRSGAGYSFARLGLMGVVERNIDPFSLHINLSAIHTFPYTDHTPPVARDIDPGEQLQFNIGIEKEIAPKWRLNYELLSELTGDSIINGDLDTDSWKFALSQLIGANYAIYDNGSYLFLGVQIPLYVRQNTGYSALVPLTGFFLAF